MSKTRKEVQADYKKSNKDRKAKLIAKWGFTTEEGFLTYLQASPEGICEVKTSGTSSEKKKRGRKLGGKNQPKAGIEVPLKPLEEVVAGEKATDYVIAFDTTGSMSSYIESVKTHVVALVGRLFTNTKNLRVKIVAFGDYCDMVSATEFGKAYQTIELTDDKQALINFVKNAKNTSGGDGDEFYELVIRKINRETKWREGTAKSVLFIADDSPHSKGYSYRLKTSGADQWAVQNNQIVWQDEAKEAAKLGIQYDTLKINSHVMWYEELSKITNGVSMNFKSAGKVSQVIEGTVYARASKTSFDTMSTKVMASGDDELIGAFKTMSTLLED